MWQSSCFFFSSRRRHTRCSRDWSSDVCSSDLPNKLAMRFVDVLGGGGKLLRLARSKNQECVAVLALQRSEERRVGKECRSWMRRDARKKKNKSSKHIT